MNRRQSLCAYASGLDWIKKMFRKSLSLGVSIFTLSLVCASQAEAQQSLPTINVGGARQGNKPVARSNGSGRTNARTAALTRASTGSGGIGSGAVTGAGGTGSGIDPSWGVALASIDTQRQNQRRSAALSRRIFRRSLRDARVSRSITPSTM